NPTRPRSPTSTANPGVRKPCSAAPTASPPSPSATSRSNDVAVGPVQSPEPPVPPREFLERGVQIRHAEVRPQHRAHDQLRVTDLPEEIVAHPHLPGRPN